MYRTVQLILGGVLVLVFGLSALSRRFPQVPWLQAFRFNRPQLSEEQQARQRRRGNFHAGIELILLGVVVPLVYLGGSLMFFNEPSTTEVLIAGAVSLLLVGLGVTAIWQNRRR